MPKTARSSRALSTLACVVALAGCAPFPSLEDRITSDARAAPYPRLQPIGPVLAQAEAIAAAPARQGGDLAARRAALEARAAALRGGVLSRADGTRLARGVTDPALQ